MQLNLDVSTELILRIIILLLRRLPIVGEGALAARVEADHRLGAKALRPVYLIGMILVVAALLIAKHLLSRFFTSSHVSRRLDSVSIQNISRYYPISLQLGLTGVLLLLTARLHVLSLGFLQIAGYREV